MKLTWNPPVVKSQGATLYNDSRHSPDVHEGAYRTDGTRMPERRYMSESVDEVDIVGTLASNFNATGDFAWSFENVAMRLHQKILDNIRSDRWYWDRVTTRSNGDTVFSPRDIYDTGELFELQKIFFFGG